MKRQVRANVQTLWLASFVLALFVASGVALALAGWAPAAIFGLLTGLLGVVSVAFPIFDRFLELLDKQDQQTDKLDTIDRRVNGELDARIESAVNRAVSGATVTVVGPDAALPAPRPPDTLTP